MSEEPQVDAKDQASVPERHRLIIMIITAIGISVLLVLISMGLYSSSGAAQLDLSRPGYSMVREQARSSGSFDAFPSTGAITEQTLDEFYELYTKRAKEATAIDAFGGDVLSSAALGIDAPTD